MDEHLDQYMEDHLNGGYGDILDQLNDEAEHAEEYPELDEPWDDDILAEQELWDFEKADEYFGYFGDEGDW